jgi:hypothetical protein
MMLKIANRKSQTLNDTQSSIDWKCKGTRLYRILLIMICISLNSFAQGNLSVTLVPKTYVGNYHLSCNGASNGEIEAVISGGTSPYSVLWNTNSTANPILNLPTGAYSVIIIDAANDTVQANYTLVQPPALNFSLEVPQFGEYNLQYYGSTFGSIKINGTGGTPSYSVVWSDSNTELIRDSLAAGNYTFVLSDANGCTTNGNKTLTQPSVLAGSVNQIHGTSCFEGDDGKAEASVTGGIPPYRYLWDNGSFSGSPEDLTAGVHEVHISDDKNNTLTLQVSITQASAIDAQITKSTYPNNFNVSCYNCFNGTMDALASGGTAPYTYEWIWQENSIGTTANLTNLGGGDYELKITDANNCRFGTTVNLKEPERQDWGMSGNAGTDPATQFIGTTDSVDVVLKSNGLEQMKITPRFTKISSGKMLLGDYAGIFQQEDTSGNKMMYFGEYAEERDFIAPPCGQSASVWNFVFPGFIFSKPSGNLEPQLSLGADGNNGLIEISDGLTNTPGYEPRLLLNYWCGNDVLVGNHQAGRLIANYKLGIKTSDPEAELHVIGTSILDGNVRIGNEHTTYDNPNNTNKKLVVEGMVYARAFKVTNDQVWPDFVFDADYTYMKLEELPLFFEKNKHLPGVPSANDIKMAGGYELNTLVPALLQKEEEIFLYLLEMQRSIKKLEQENIDLRAEVASLKNN